MLSHRFWSFGGEEKRPSDKKRRKSSRTRPRLRGETLEPRNLLSGNPVLIPSAAGASHQPQPSVPSASSGAVQTQPQEPDISMYDGPFVYDGFAHRAIATAANSQDFLVSGSFTYTYNGSSDPPTNAGSYTVVATFTSSDPSYSNGTETSTMVIAPATPRITLTGGTFSFDTNPHPAVATEVGVDGVTPVSGSFSFTYNGSSTPPTNPGSYAVVASFASADPNYASTTATTTISINTIPTGVTVTGASTTSVTVAWNPVLEPAGATPTYNIYERVSHSSGGGKGSHGSYYTYNLVASGLAAASDTITGLAAAPAGGIAPSHPYVVTSVLNGVSSPYSTLTSGAPLYAPALNSYFLLNGALWLGSSPVNVTVGQTVQVSVLGYGNPAPTYSVASGPSSVSIDPKSGVISISPTAADATTFTATFAATNSLGSVTSPSLSVHVLALPTVAVTGGSFAFDGNTHGASAVAYGSDGVMPLAGTFSFQYAPAQYPTSLSTGEYAEVGSYIVQATFTSSDPNYGNAIGTGTLNIVSSTPTIIIDGGPFTNDGTSHAATVTALGFDGVSSVAGSFALAYNGSADPPSTAGSYVVSATFTSSDPDYASTTATGTLVIGGSQTAPAVAVTVGATSTVVLDGSTVATGNTTNITNNSVSGDGVLVTGVNQIVGGIDGAGNLVINSGASLTANHIVQGSLVIGGDASNPATVTIAPSDSNGNPVTSLAATVASSQTAVAAAAMSSGNVLAGASNAPALALGLTVNSPSTGSSSAGGETTNPSGVTTSSSVIGVTELPSVASIASPAASDCGATAEVPQAQISAAAGPKSIAFADDPQSAISVNERHAELDAIFADRGTTTATDIDALLDQISTGADKDAADQLAIEMFGSEI